MNSAGWLRATLTDLSPCGLPAPILFAFNWRLSWAGPSRMTPALQGVALNSCQSIPWLPLQLGNWAPNERKHKLPVLLSLESEVPEHYFNFLLIKASHQTSSYLSGGVVDHLQILVKTHMLRGATNCWLPYSKAFMSSQPLLSPPPLYPVRDIKNINTSTLKFKNNHKSILIFHLLANLLILINQSRLTLVLSFSTFPYKCL